ncbi:MAG: Glu-tRNA(Gln) amidotransferase GatDE subunit D [Nanohaloarchaea archaeon SW_7_46_7]|nr:MAG: Glu-tRNA(Gln) amidotransferase GatDE subunit D [Nanohaloarchaea archaeon SW_7_46_7]
MYSQGLQQKFEEKNIEVGDRIKVKDREGRLMPKPDTGDSEIINLKLDSGYNVGLEPEKVELVEKKESEGLKRPEVTHNEDNPDVLILHTGGTIASRVSYKEGGVKPAFEPEDLVQMYPELDEEVNIHSEVIAQMLSEDMEPGHWQEIAEKIDEVQGEYDGIIVGHGTDTMSYTGAALTLMLQGLDTGVMLVGSQRSSDRPSSDASMNVYCASKFLTETEFSGIGICMHETSSDNWCNILPAAKARKMHTSRRNAFSQINAEKIGRINYKSGEIQKNFEKEEEEYELRPELDDKVGMLRIRPGMRPEEVDFLIEQDYNGVVIEGTGLGHMPVNAFDDKTQHHDRILEKLSELAEDAVVVMSSQCLNGRVDMNVYSAGIKIQEAGVISAQDMHPELAYVKLMWSLGQASDKEEAEQIFQENYSGEISKRSMYSG